MQNDKIYSEVLKLTKTTDDRDRVVTEIDALIAGMYKTDKSNFTKTLGEFVSTDISKQIGSIDTNSLDNVLVELKNKLMQLPTIKVTLAFVPKQNFVNEIAEFIEKNINLKGVIELTHNPEILGGIILDIGGKYIDLSLKRKLDEAIQK